MRRRPAAAPALLRRPAAAERENALQAAEPSSGSTGPLSEQGSRAGWGRRQYCWWITFSHPHEVTAAQQDLKTPSSLAEPKRETFLKAVQEAHAAAGTPIEEAAVFLEKHQRTDSEGNRLVHLNALVRAKEPYSWRPVAQQLYLLHRMRVDFSEHIRTWRDGVMYGVAASEHKGAEELDDEALQWPATAIPLDQVLPGKFNAQKARHPRLSSLQAYDLCVVHKLHTPTEAWAKAHALDKEGDRGLLAFLLEHKSVEEFLSKVNKALMSGEILRRQSLGRLGVLREASEESCSCEEEGLWLRLAKQTLERNGVAGAFQRQIYMALEKGRGKPRNIFLIGPTTCGKSWIIKPLSEIFRPYLIPDDGSHQLEAIFDCELIYLNEFEWTPDWLKWAHLKKLFEGEAISVGRPKTRGMNCDYTGDAPIIGTCSAPIQLFIKQGRNAVLNRYETDQMVSRVTYIYFTHSLQRGAESDAIDCKVCRRCAAQLYLEGSDYAVAPAHDDATLRDRERSRSPVRLAR